MKNRLSPVEYEVLTALLSGCNMLKVSRRFERICFLHFQDWKLSQTRNMHEATFSFACYFIMLGSCLAYPSTLKMDAIYSSATVAAATKQTLFPVYSQLL
jgi:hypothetical protein